MGVIVHIPVQANAMGDCVRVRIATTMDCETPPDPIEFPRIWRIVADVPNEDLPTEVETPARPRGTCVWYMAAAYENGVRVSAYSTPAVIAIPSEIGIIGGEITVIGSGVI